MNLRLILTCALLCSFPVFAEESTCEPGKLRKCFVDGSNTNCLCIDEPSEVASNPEAEPDGQINEDGGGQEG